MFKKNKEWRQSCVDYIIGASDSSIGGSSRDRSDEM
jgi:hypothetical protein